MTLAGQWLEEGIEKGRKGEKMDMAKKMKDENYPIKDIARLTELRIEEIERL